jgi:hypothetical protein
MGGRHARRRRRAGLAALLLLLACAGISPELAAAQDRPDKALGQPASASSDEFAREGGLCAVREECRPEFVNDGKPDTRWSSEYRDGEHWQVDLGRPRLVDTVAVTWQTANADEWEVQTSLDGASFQTAVEAELRLSPAERAELRKVRRYDQTVSFPVRSARYVRIVGVSRATRFGTSMWNASVFGPEDPPETAAAPAPEPTLAAPAPAPAPMPAPAEPPPPAPAPAAAAPALVALAPTPVVRIRGRITSRGARITLLTVRAPRGARVRVRCRGRSCPRRTRMTLRGDLRRVRGLERPLRAGVVIEVLVTLPGTSGSYTRLEIRRGSAPRRSTGCVLPGTQRRVDCPAP